MNGRVDRQRITTGRRGVVWLALFVFGFFLLPMTAIIPWLVWAVIASIAFGWLLWLEKDAIFHLWENRIRAKLVHAMMGWSFWALTNWSLDNILYPTVIVWLGLIHGGLLMTLGAVAFNGIYLLMYERIKSRKGIDLLGMDSIGDLKSKIVSAFRRLGELGRARTIVGGFVRITLFLPKLVVATSARAISGRGWFPFVVLSVFTDSFVTTAYFRRELKGALRLWDWTIFLVSTVLGNIYWSLRSYLVVVGLQGIWLLIHRIPIWFEPNFQLLAI